jgi:LmbE family N-acetylglucosaminyl deacetylase
VKTLVIAPHPDDETLGLGGTLLKRKKSGHEIGWLIVTSISVEEGWDEAFVNQRNHELAEITQLYGFTEVFKLGFPSTKLELVPFPILIESISEKIRSFDPEEIFVPHPSDIHSDHKKTYEATIAATKWFRGCRVKRLLAYETLSETEVDPLPNNKFRPNFYVNIEEELHSKMAALEVYQSECGDFPFPRSTESIKVLSQYRGLQVGCRAAEAFQLLRELES